MSSATKLRQVVRSRRAFVRRLLVAELLSRRGEGPLAPRFDGGGRPKGAGTVAAGRPAQKGPR